MSSCKVCNFEQLQSCNITERSNKVESCKVTIWERYNLKHLKIWKCLHTFFSCLFLTQCIYNEQLCRAVQIWTEWKGRTKRQEQFTHQTYFWEFVWTHLKYLGWCHNNCFTLHYLGRLKLPAKRAMDCKVNIGCTLSLTCSQNGLICDMGHSIIYTSSILVEI